MPLISMDLIGRTGNLLFQYAYLRAVAERDGYEIALPPWIGERVFAGVPEAVRSNKIDRHLGQDYAQRQECLIYTRKQVREWFRFKPGVEEKLQPAKSDSDDIVLNIRHGKDYLSANMVCISLGSYLEACEVIKKGEWNIILELSETPTRLKYFDGDEWASGFNTTWVGLPSFYKLMTAPILFRANSTFSWWAATLGNGRVFSPVIEGMKGGIPNQHCSNFVEGNWSRMSQVEGFTDLHIKEA